MVPCLFPKGETRSDGIQNRCNGCGLDAGGRYPHRAGRVLIRVVNDPKSTVVGYLFHVVCPPFSGRASREAVRRDGSPND